MRLSITATTVFERSWQTTGRIVVHRGSTRSSKTYSNCQQIAIWLMTGQIRANLRIDKGRATIVRKHQTTLSKTVEADFIAVLVDLGVYGMVTHNKTNKTFSFSGREVFLIGADDQQKIRGYKSNILYCNEANELNYDQEFFQLFIRTTDLVILDLNPSDPYIWVNEKIEQERAQQDKDVDVIVSTFKDNPYITDAQRKEIERLERVDPQLWQVYGLGQYGKIEGLVYPDFVIVDEMPKALSKRAYGLDFGFGADPVALLDCGVLNKTELYVDELIYNTGLTNPDLCDAMKGLKLQPLQYIWADAAEPKSIEEIRRAGYAIKAASKGADSVKYGINTVQRFKLHVTARSLNVIKELRKYKWATDNQGRPYSPPKPIGDYNHALDALRYYAVMEHGSTRTALPSMLS